MNFLRLDEIFSQKMLAEIAIFATLDSIEPGLKVPNLRFKATFSPISAKNGALKPDFPFLSIHPAGWIN